MSLGVAIGGRSNSTGRPFLSGQRRRSRMLAACMTVFAALTTLCMMSSASAALIASSARTAARRDFGRPPGLPLLPGENEVRDLATVQSPVLRDYSCGPSRADIRAVQQPAVLRPHRDATRDALSRPCAGAASSVQLAPTVRHGWLPAWQAGASGPSAAAWGGSGRSRACCHPSGSWGVVLILASSPGWTHSGGRPLTTAWGSPAGWSPPVTVLGISQQQ